MPSSKKESLIVLKKYKSGGGYTLIEIMVAVGIFFIVIAAPTGFFTLSLKGQIKTLASQELIDNTSYVLEYISRAIRMAKKDLDGSCLEPKLNYKKTTSRTISGITYSGPGIKFENYQEPPVCQEFFLDESQGQLMESKNGGGPLALTSKKLEVTSFNIGPDNSWDQNDNEQPRITLFLEIKGRGLKPEWQPKIKIQTTISQRDLDVTY